MQYKPEFEYKIEDCDVVDRDSVSRFREKLSEWRYIFTGDKHSIIKQISQMMWSDIIYRFINKSRSINIHNSLKASSLNRYLAYFIDDGYVNSQSIYIRRLLENSKKPKEKHRQIISLKRILDDIYTHRNIITREAYVCHDGLPYDQSHQMYSDYICNVVDSRMKGINYERLPTSGPQAYNMSNIEHNEFDRLSDVNTHNRSRLDKINDNYFDKLYKMLDESECKNVVNFTNKFIAHSADDFSRKALQNSELNITLGRLSNCHEILCCITNILGADIIGVSTNIIPHIIMNNKFEFLEQPWISEKFHDELEEFWSQHVAMIERWGRRE